jgi:hypothetical protein
MKDLIYITIICIVLFFSWLSRNTPLEYLAYMCNRNQSQPQYFCGENDNSIEITLPPEVSIVDILETPYWSEKSLVLGYDVRE